MLLSITTITIQMVLGALLDDVVQVDGAECLTAAGLCSWWCRGRTYRSREEWRRGRHLVVLSRSLITPLMMMFNDAWRLCLDHHLYRVCTSNTPTNININELLLSPIFRTTLVISLLLCHALWHPRCGGFQSLEPTAGAHTSTGNSTFKTALKTHFRSVDG